MGSIYRPKYKDRHGETRESAVWWISYYTHGRQIRESTETADYGDAKEKLKAERRRCHKRPDHKEHGTQGSIFRAGRTGRKGL